LTLTCTSIRSRNYSLGIELGAGTKHASELTGGLAAGEAVAEGVYTAAGVLARAGAFGLEMPIMAAVAAILHDGADIGRTIETLLARPFRREDEAV
jgi:glycerol-3-phosphate dehydrogenase (NAD(P)+)